jgi:hypothetical protein
MQTICEFLKANPRFSPIDVFEPEQCALCSIEEDDENLFHIVMDEGKADIEVFIFN